MLRLPKEEREKIIKHYIKLVQLDDFVNLYPKHLSDSMRKRVYVVRTFAINPDVLLHAEFFGSLDGQTMVVKELIVGSITITIKHSIPI